MSQSDNKLYEFGSFRLDTVERVLWRDEEILVLPPKVFETLVMLVKKGGGVVSKSELMDAIWADAFVEESNLSQNIYTLRRTLGIDAQGKQFIETVPRRGYRFAAPIRALSTSEVKADTEKQTNEIVFSDSAPKVLAESPEPNLNQSSFALTTKDPQAIATTHALLAPSSVLHEKVRSRSVVFYALWAGFGVLILSALGFGIYQFVIRRPERTESKVAPIEQLRFQRLTDSGDVVYPTISPDGKWLAYVRLEEAQGSLWVKQIATGSSVQALPPSTKGYDSLAFSHDGSYLFFREEADGGAMYQTSVFGGTPKKVADNVWSDFSLSPDGKQFAFIRRDAGRNAHLLMLANTDGGGERELSARQTPLDYRGNPAWSPDGTRIVVAGGREQQILPTLLIIDVSTGKQTELKAPHWRAVSRVLWTPSGKHLLVAAREINEPTSQLWMISYPEGEVRRLTNDLEAYFWLSLSADGRMLVTRQQKVISHLWLMPDGDLNKARQLTFGGRNLDGYVGLTWMPDGKILFSSLAGHITDLHSMDADGVNRVEMTSNAGQDNTYPTASRDGRYIVFISNRSGTGQIWRMDRDGRNQKQLTFGEQQTERAQSAALSPDGAEVFFIKRGTGPAAIWKVPIEGGATVQVSHLTNATTEGFVSISPDGKWLAYRHVSTQPEARSEIPTVRIGVLPTDGSAEPKLFDLPMRRPIVQWSSDSTSFDYSAGTFNSSSLMRQSLAGGESQKLLDFPDRIFNFAWSPVGKSLVVARGKLQGDAILITNLP
jgi:Tol biopolymer transport system component/DNA-binding winged helix-turn-helix (wHTH) protein